MMLYRVVKYFTDLHDNDHPYDVGDIFPRPGVSVTDARLAELASGENRRGIPLIAAIEEPEEKPKKAKKASKKAAKE